MSKRVAGRTTSILLRRPVPDPKNARGPFAPQYRSYSAPEVSPREHESIILPDQRTLSFARYGAKDGYPVFYFHGHPGSRMEAALVHEDAAKLGANLISIDRPGLGYSTLKPGRKPSDFAEDVKHLAEELGLSEYKILAVSGGGPYALASARFPTAKLRAVALLAGMVWIPEIGYRRMRMGNKIMFHATKSAPSIARWVLGFSVPKQLSLSDEALVKVSLKQINSRIKRFPPKDKELLADGSLVRQVLPSTREHFRQGVDGFMDEFRILNNEVDFDLDKINSIPISLWYGSQDINVPSAIGEELAKRLKSAKLNILDETHLSLLMNQKRRILEDLLNRS